MITLDSYTNHVDGGIPQKESRKVKKLILLADIKKLSECYFSDIQFLSRLLETLSNLRLVFLDSTPFPSITILIDYTNIVQIT